MKISLFQGILYGIFGIAALIGLFVFATHTSKTNKSTVGTVVVWGTLPKEGIQAALITLMKTDMDLKNVSYIEKNSTTLTSDISAAIATGNAPDAILASQEELYTLVKFISPTPLTTLPSRTFINTFAEGGGIFTVPNGGGYYGTPFLIDPLVLFSNRSILASSGIARPPATWEALTGLVPNVALLTPSRQITRGLIALGTYDNVRNARGILSSLFFQTGVPVSSYSNNGVLTANLGISSGAELRGQAVLGFYTQFADPSKVSYTWNTSLADSEQMFLNGDLALYIGYASEARFLKVANPNLDFDVAPLPQPSTATVKSVYGLIYAFMIPRGAKNAEGAYQAAALLANSAEQAVVADATGLAPATLSQLAIAPSDPVATVAYLEALYTKGWLSPTSANTDSVFSSMIGSVIAGRLNLEAALALAERSLSSLLQQ